jgi:serpin B
VQAPAPKPKPAEAVATLETVKKTVDGGNQFAVDLFGQLRKEKGNLFLSPYSISTALAMTSAGARGTTDEQMIKALRLIPEQAERHAGFAELIRLTSRAQDKGIQLNVVNALWGHEDFRFLDEFIGTTDKSYGATFRRVNFIKTEEARKTINDYIEQCTNQKIKELIPTGVLSAEYTRLVLTNAIYFKGDWASQFKKEQTVDGAFFTQPDAQVKAKLMQQTGQFKLYQDAEVQVLELPYAGKNLSMVVLLPARKHGLEQLEAGFNAAKLETWLSKMVARRKVDVVLPRFKTTSKFKLKDTLSAMGMAVAFSPAGADFSGMTGQQPAYLYIKDVIHQGFVEVNEEGTEAAGATAVIVNHWKSADATPSFRADHPFLFLIRDHTTGSILFLGRMADPTK